MVIKMKFKSKLIKIITITVIIVIMFSIAAPLASASVSGTWQQGAGGWWFQRAGGGYSTGWELINGTWYYFSNAGWMQTGWVLYQGAWFFLRSSGAMATGWTFDGSQWYYLRSSGAMATGWHFSGGHWYFLHPNGVMAQGWAFDGSHWYYMVASGQMATGWVNDRGLWYFMRDSGAMATGVVAIGGVNHTFASSGHLTDRLGTNRLTGRPMPEILVNRRPLAISLGNAPAAATLPINGVASADIIYEVPLEGNVTRMIGIFSHPDSIPQVGSIRSARYYIANIAESYDAILVSAGRSFLARDHIPARNIDWVNAVEGTVAHRQMFNRNRDRIPGRTIDNYHSVVTRGSLVSRLLPTYGFRLSHNSGFNNRLTFTDNATPAGGAVANEINVVFSPFKSSAFTFDTARGVYHMRQSHGTAVSNFVDANNNARVEFANLIILRTRVEASPADAVPPLESNRLREVDTLTNISGTGTGYFVHGGRQIPINWERPNHTSPFIYTLRDGTPLNLGRGTTYVALVPLDASVTFR
jgi:hypothetical protein